MPGLPHRDFRPLFEKMCLGVRMHRAELDDFTQWFALPHGAPERAKAHAVRYLFACRASLQNRAVILSVTDQLRDGARRPLARDNRNQLLSA